MRVKYDYDELKDDEGYYSIWSEKEFDCKTKKVRTLKLGALSYSLGLMLVNYKTQKWEPLNPYSGDEAYWNIGCKKIASTHLSFNFHHYPLQLNPRPRPAS